MTENVPAFFETHAGTRGSRLPEDSPTARGNAGCAVKTAGTDDTASGPGTRSRCGVLGGLAPCRPFSSMGVFKNADRAPLPPASSDKGPSDFCGSPA